MKIGFSSGCLLGHIIFKKRIGIDPEKIEAMLETPFPTTKCEVRAFLGITGYYRQFIEQYDNTLTPQATPDALEIFEKIQLSITLSTKFTDSKLEFLFLFFHRCIMKTSRCNFSTVG